MKAKGLSAAAAVLMLAVVLAAIPLTIPRLFGYQIYNILTRSMEPDLPPGSAIYVKEWDAQALQPGDVVTFTLGSSTGLVETHRVVRNDPETRQLVTKGDANAQPDIDPVSYDRVVGKVIFSIPVLGAASQWVHTGSGIAVCIAIFALAFILWTLADKMNKRESFK